MNITLQEELRTLLGFIILLLNLSALCSYVSNKQLKLFLFTDIKCQPYWLTISLAWIILSIVYCSIPLCLLLLLTVNTYFYYFD